MGVVSVAFALKLTKDNRVGLAASETPSPPSLNSRAGDAWAATAEQQQVVRFPLRPGHEYSPCIPGALTSSHTLRRTDQVAPLRRRPVPLQREQRENRASEALNAAESGLSPRELRQMRAKAATALAAAQAPAVPVN